MNISAGGGADPHVHCREEIKALRARLDELYTCVYRNNGGAGNMYGGGRVQSPAVAGPVGPQQPTQPWQYPYPTQGQQVWYSPGQFIPPQSWAATPVRVPPPTLPPPRYRNWVPQPRVPPKQEGNRRRTTGPVEREYRTKIRQLVRQHKSGAAPPPARCNIEEVEGDILRAGETVRCHAVGADLWCSQGLARDVVENFGRPTDLRESPKVGDILPVSGEDDDVWLFLVTKEKSWHKPRHDFEAFIRNVQFSIENLARYVIQTGIREIAIPHLCSGLDRLNWLYVRNLIRHNLRDVDVKVVVYHLPRPQEQAEDGGAAAERDEPPFLTPQQPLEAESQKGNEQDKNTQSPSVANLIRSFEPRQERWPKLPHPMSTPRGRKHQVPPLSGNQDSAQRLDGEDHLASAPHF